jgi:hypothetical protein
MSACLVAARESQRLWSKAEVNRAQKTVLKYVESHTVSCECKENFLMNCNECGDS